MKAHQSTRENAAEPRRAPALLKPNISPGICICALGNTLKVHDRLQTALGMLFIDELSKTPAPHHVQPANSFPAAERWFNLPTPTVLSSILGP